MSKCTEAVYIHNVHLRVIGRLFDKVDACRLQVALPHPEKLPEHNLNPGVTKRGFVFDVTEHFVAFI